MKQPNERPLLLPPFLVFEDAGRYRLGILFQTLTGHSQTVGLILCLLHQKHFLDAEKNLEDLYVALET